MYDLAGLCFISNIMSVNINFMSQGFALFKIGHPLLLWHLTSCFCTITPAFNDILMTLDAFLTLVKDVSICIAFTTN